jgi:hypothetical protein
MTSLWRTLISLSVVVIASQSSISFASNSSSGFTSAEHTILGDSIKLYFAPQDPGQKGMPLQMPNGLKVTYGDIVSVGDFYEIPGQPVSLGKSDSDRKARFLAAFNSFALNASVINEATQILAVIHNEKTTIDEAIKKGQKAEDVYKEIASDLDRQFNCITGGGCATKTWWLTPGRYLTLANEDYDHFGANAWLTYQTGHEMALQQAADAHQTSDLKKLEIAYAMNAFACHFLSDRFSSGHIRTPRTELPANTTPSLTGTLLSEYMHDEESEYGLHVHNVRGDYWTAYGDRYYHNPKNTEHVRLTLETLQASADQIFYAYRTGDTSVANDLHDLIPQADEIANTGKLDIAPLFYWDEASHKLMRRENMSNPYDRHWTDSWWGWSTLAELKRERGITLKSQAALALSDHSEQALQQGLIENENILAYTKEKSSH